MKDFQSTTAGTPEDD